MADDDNSSNDSSSARGFAAMSDEEAHRIQSQGGKASPTKFKPGDQRTVEAGRRGGKARGSGNAS